MENFTNRNLDININASKESLNIKSLIYAVYINYIENNDIKFSNKKYFIQEKEIHDKLKIENNICKFGFKIQQANIIMNYLIVKILIMVLLKHQKRQI